MFLVILGCYGILNTINRKYDNDKKGSITILEREFNI